MSFTSDYEPTLPVSAFHATSRFDCLFDVYGLSLKQRSDPGQRSITLIARSPASPPAQALALNLARFQPFSVEVNVILAQIAPSSALKALVRALRPACEKAPEMTVRWARNRALLEAHERLTLGRTLCWTGDSMRRMDEAKSALDRVEDCTESMLSEARASFHALWQASKPLPETLLADPVVAGPGQAYQAHSAKQAADAHIVHLDDYIRSRRH